MLGRTYAALLSCTCDEVSMERKSERCMEWKYTQILGKMFEMVEVKLNQIIEILCNRIAGSKLTAQYIIQRRNKNENIRCSCPSVRSSLH
jgi:hypothetical protein